MKRIIPLILCLCLLFSALSGFTAFADETEETIDAAGVIDENIENYYANSDTIYNLENEEDTPREPEETAPPKEVYKGDDDFEIYGNESFDEENAVQLQGEYVIDELIIKFKDSSQVPGKEEQLQEEIKKVQKLGFVECLDLYVIKVDELQDDPNAVLNRYKNNKYIEYVEPNYILEPEFIPNDPSYKSQSLTLTAIGAQAAWDILMGSSSPVIAVVDSGVSAHADLPPLLDGYAAVSSLSPNKDSQAHGTGVAGTIGAVGNNGIGGAGLNWNASIMPVKVDDAKGSLSVANVAKGIIWAADNGAMIINLSLGFASDSVTLRNAIDYAYEKGCAIFAAAGNSGSSVSYPARYANVMGVGSSGNGTTRLASSNYGIGLDVVAMSSYYTLTPTGGYKTQSGTSFATPQVSALASMVWALNPDLTNDQVYEIIENGCKTLGGGVNEATGYGVINMANTLQLALDYAGTVMPEPTATPEPSPEPTATPEPSPEPTATPEPSPEPTATPEPLPEPTATPEPLPEPTATPEPLPEPTATPVVEAVETELPPQSTQTVSNPPTIRLIGFTEMTLEYGQAFKETGYIATDCNNKNLTGSVKVTNTIDIWTPGLYTVTYEITDANGLSARATRTVTVNPKPVEEIPVEAPTITIIGSDPIILHLTSGTPYTEQLARAIDYDGTDISNLVTVASGSVNRAVAGTYTLTYSVTSPTSGLTSTATRNVRIVSPYEMTDERVEYSVSGQAKKGGVITHTGITSDKLGYMDLTVTSISKNMTISVEFINTVTNKAVFTDTYSSAGAKQYKIDEGQYKLVVTVIGANGNGKFDVDMLMPEADPVFYFDEEEVPLAGIPQIAPIGSNPIILHLGGSDYIEQGAKAIDYLGNDISDQVKIIGEPDISTPGTYKVTYKVVGELGIEAEVTREVRILAPVATEIGREIYNLSGQGKQGDKTTHGGIKAEESGVLDLQIDDIDEDMEISIELINAQTDAVEFKDTYPAADYRQYEIKAGEYELVVTIDKANDTGSYELTLKMPETVTMIFIEDEVPLPEYAVVVHVVAEGETLWSIAKKQLGDGRRWREIYEANKEVIGSDPNTIYVGQTLTIILN